MFRPGALVLPFRLKEQGCFSLGKEEFSVESNSRLKNLRGNHQKRQIQGLCIGVMCEYQRQWMC